MLRGDVEELRGEEGLVAALAAAGLSLATPSLATPALAAKAPAAALVSPGGVPWTWGANSFGQLGDGSTSARPTPGPVTGLTDVVVRVDRGPQRVTAVVSAHATLVLDLGLGSIEETASGPRERVSVP